DFFFSRRGPWPVWENRGGGGRRDSGVGAHRGRGESGGKASRRREEPKGGLGWARGGREGLLRGEQRPAAAFGGGGGGAAGLGGDEWVREHQWGSVVLAAGSVWCEDGWRRGLRGDLEGGGGHGGGGCSGRREGARPGAQSREERGGEVGGVLAKQWEGREQNKE